MRSAVFAADRRLAVRRDALVVWLLGAFALSGCGGRPDAVVASEALVRDSASIIIIKNPWPATLPVWEIETLPSLTIGGGSELPGHELHRTRGAVVLESGGVALADGSTRQIRVFGADGGLARTIGREGKGPGEFTLMSLFHAMPGDSLHAWDHTLKRATLVSAHEGGFTTTSFASVPNNGSLRVAARLEGGNYLAWGGRRPMSEIPQGLVRDSALVRIFDARAEVLEVIGLIPHAMFFFAQREVGGQSMPIQIVQPYSPAALAVADRGRVYVASTEKYEIAVYDAGGRLRRSIRLGRELEPLDEAEGRRQAAEMTKTMIGTDPYSAAERDVYSVVPLPKAMPAFSQMLAGGGHLFVEEVRKVGGARSWLVFDSTGVLAATLRPGDGAGLEGAVLEMGPDHVLVLARDTLGVESVMVHRILRPRR